jgi:hypothetical protein
MVMRETRLAQVWRQLRRQAATGHEPSPPTLETFFDRIAWNAEHGF